MSAIRSPRLGMSRVYVAAGSESRGNHRVARSANSRPTLRDHAGMRQGKDLSKRHKTRSAIKLVDFDVLSRQLSRLDPEWRERKKLGGPIHRDAVELLRRDSDLRDEQPPAA
jgi:hypothetical protein